MLMMMMRSKFDSAVKGTDVIRRFKRVIQNCTGGGTLLTRYHLINNRFFGIYLHHLQSSDEDRACHDHPWSFISILLTGGYGEWTPHHRYDRENRTIRRQEKMIWYPRWSVLRRPAEWQYRLQLDKPVWTLVFRGPERRVWGFLPSGTWMHHVAYGKTFCD